MTLIGWFQIVLFIGLILALTRPFGTFMYKVFEGETTWLTPSRRIFARTASAAAGPTPSVQ